MSTLKNLKKSSLIINVFKWLNDNNVAGCRGRITSVSKLFDIKTLITFDRFKFNWLLVHYSIAGYTID